MAVLHDAYLCDLEGFANTIRPYLAVAHESATWYRLLRSQAIRLYDEDPQIRALASAYGGWDRDAVLTQVAADWPSTPQDTAFWIVICLYGHLVHAEPEPLGLGRRWHRLRLALETVGWSQPDADVVIKGRSFETFPGRWLGAGNSSFPNASAEPSVWRSMDLMFPSGSVGWLGLDECQELLDRVAALRAGIEVSRLGEDATALRDVYQSAVAMFQAATAAQCGLCMILSG